VCGAADLRRKRLLNSCDGDDADALAARILAHEHLLLPRAVRWVAEGRVRVEGRRVRVTATSAHASP
jgi:phosphoribosylglycinamide formyltransferase-1